MPCPPIPVSLGMPPLPRESFVQCIDQMSFYDAFVVYMKRLDDAFGRLRAMHADIEHINSISKPYTEVVEEMTAITKRIWSLKNEWREARDAKAKE